MSSDISSSSFGRDLRWIAGLLALLALEFVIGSSTGPGEGSLRQTAATGTAEQRVEALHILANFDEPSLDPALVSELLSDPEALVREWTMTSDVWRTLGRQAQLRYLEKSATEDERIRGHYYLRRTGRPMTHEKLDAYFASLESQE